MNGLIKYFLPAGLLFTATFLLTSMAQAEEQLIDKVAAIVDADVVLISEVNNLIQQVSRSALKAGKALPDQVVLHKQTLERLISESLQLQLADRMGVKVGDSQLEESISAIAQEQGKTREQYLAQLKADGISYSVYREQVRNEMIISQVRQAQVRRRIHISDQEVDALIALIKKQGAKQELYDVGHILIKVGSSASALDLEQARGKAQTIVDSLKAGANFHDLALSNSDGPKALEGGDWGFMNINEMPTLFAEVVQDHNTGDVFGPLKTSSGFHIIKILNTQGRKTVEQLEVNARHILIKPSIILSDKKAKSILNDFLQQIQSGEATFEQLAQQYSEDPGSAIRGGALGWASPDTYVPAFKTQVANLKAGETSKPFRSTYGWHIIKLDDRRVTDATENAIKNQAYELLFRRKFSEEAQMWLDELREEAYVQIIEIESSND